MDWGSVPAWVGSVPAWIGTVSVIVAVRAFRRDRRAAERSQVSLVAAWAEVEYDRRAPDVSPRLEDVKIVCFFRNASQLPVHVVEAHWRIETTWLVAKTQSPAAVQVGVWEPVPGTDNSSTFHYDVQLPPDKTIETAPFDLNVAHHAPADAVQLHSIDGVKVRLECMTLVDNAGRQWRRPGTGPAERIG